MSDLASAAFWGIVGGTIFFVVVWAFFFILFGKKNEDPAPIYLHNLPEGQRVEYCTRRGNIRMAEAVETDSETGNVHLRRRGISFWRPREFVRAA